MFGYTYFCLILLKLYSIGLSIIIINIINIIGSATNGVTTNGLILNASVVIYIFSLMFSIRFPLINNLCELIP